MKLAESLYGVISSVISNTYYNYAKLLLLTSVASIIVPKTLYLLGVNKFILKDKHLLDNNLVIKEN